MDELGDPYYLKKMREIIGAQLYVNSKKMTPHKTQTQQSQIN